MENKLIALYGPAGSGKDFFCKALKFIYNKVVAQYYSNTLEPVSPKYFQLFTEFFIDEYKEEDDYVFRLAFADQLKESISVTFNVPLTWLHDSYYKDNAYINMSTLELYKSEEDIPKGTDYIIVSDELYANVMYTNVFGGPSSDEDRTVKSLLGANRVFMKIRDLITYYGTYVMRNTFGNNFWISNLFSKKEFNLYNQKNMKGSPGYVLIVTDVRFQNEYEELKDKGAIFIKIESDFNEKSVGGVPESFYDNFTYDYIFENSKDEFKFAYNLKKIFEKLFPQLIESKE